MPGFWRKCRIAFRWARFTIWGSLLLLLAGFAWFNLVGLPDFLKTRLVTALHERGVQLEFSRMRLRIVHGLICDNVRIGATHETNAPVFTARQVQLRINFPALLHLRPQIDGLVLSQGKISLPLADGAPLLVTNVEGELRILPENTWSLDQLRADLAGVTVTLGGAIAHAPEGRNWKMFGTAQNADRGSVQASLRSFSDTLKAIHFEGKPLISARLDGDARDVHSFTLTVNARVPTVTTSWFSAHNLEFATRVSVPTNIPVQADPAWGLWTNLQPFQVSWLARGTDLKSSLLDAEAMDCSGTWNAPQFAVNKFAARLGGGSLDAVVNLDVTTREVNFTVNSAFDLHAVSALIMAKTRERLEKIAWTTPPQLNATGRLVLPSWTAPAEGWHDGIEPTIRLGGELAFTNGTVADGLRLDAFRAQFAYSNLVWNLKDMEVRQRGTALELSGEESEVSKNFRVELEGQLDASSVRPFLASSNAVRGFNQLSFARPVTVRLDLAGNLKDAATLSATGLVAAADFAIRKQTIDRLSATLSYTNQTIEFFHPQLARAGGAEAFAAERLTLDIPGERLLLHRGKGHVSPRVVAAAIGPKTAEAMEPYHFLSLPEASVDGCIPLKHRGEDLVTDDADLRFDVLGSAPFRWRKFETRGITGTIHWLAGDLILTNVVSECYDGTARGWAVFNLETPGAGTDFSFFIDATNVDFNSMGRALWDPTNQLRGDLSGQVTVTSANSDDWRTWDGYGDLQLHNGLLWNAPILGLMSSIFNRLAPGWDIGNSRATDGAGHFAMTNGVIYTDTLVISTRTTRIDYVGTVDLEEKIAARARAQPFRNTPVFGSIFSMVLSPVGKAFECEVTGTLGNPEIAPVYIPKILTAPLHPIRTMEKMFSAPATNGPPQP